MSKSVFVPVIDEAAALREDLDWFLENVGAPGVADESAAVELAARSVASLRQSRQFLGCWVVPLLERAIEHR